MPVQNNLRLQVDLPLWEYARFAPATVTATSALASADDGSNRYLYYIVAAAFYRYDTWTDTWQQLGSPAVAAATGCSLRYSVYSGFRGWVLGSTSNTITVPGFTSNVSKGLKVRIISGTGAGQERTITAASEVTVWDYGVATATTSGTQIQDTVKKWKYNQWQGYMCAVVFGTGAMQFRKILYNDTQTMYFNDVNYQAINSWGNTGFSAVAPYVVPASTAGAQSFYQIQSKVLTVDTPWTTQPDTTSRFMIMSGGIWLFSGAASPFYTLQYYDVLGDAWYSKTAVTGLTTATGTDFTIERTGEVAGAFMSGSVVSATPYSVTLPSASIPNDRYAYHQLRITAGTGIGQRRTTIGNYGPTFYTTKQWDVTPDTTSSCSVYPNTDRIFGMLGGQAALFGYSVEADMWTQGEDHDYGVAHLFSARNPGVVAVGVTSMTRNTGSIISIDPIPAAGGLNYVTGDILTVGLGGTLGKVIVNNIASGGVVTNIGLLGCGLNYNQPWTNRYTTGGTGAGCTVNILATGSTGRIVTAINHPFQIGDTVILGGAVDPSWNVTGSVLGCDGLTTGFDVAISASASATAVASGSLDALHICDSSKIWNVNEHFGKLVQTAGTGITPTGQVRRITSNTFNTLTLNSGITAPVAGQTRYTIFEPQAFGRDAENGVMTSKASYGYASSGSAGTSLASSGSIVDNTKNWQINEWATYRVRIVAGSGSVAELPIFYNTANTLFVASASVSPGPGSKYIIMDSFGISSGGSGTTLVDQYKNWTVNQWAGKRLKFMSGTGQNQDIVIASNTNNTLTTAANTNPLTDTNYTILGVPPRSTGMTMQWVFNNSNTLTEGMYIYVARGGGSNIIDRYNITTQLWEYGFYILAQPETLNTGCMYSYDGNDRIYFTTKDTPAMRVMYYDLVSNAVMPAGQPPYGAGAVLIGNRAEIIKTADGLKYMYIMRHTGTEMWRGLIYW
jgi:hypothetical protein